MTARASATAIVLLALAVSAQAAHAAPPAATVKEVDHLLRYLENSGCQFARGGTWHDAKAARGHLDMKYNYLLKQDMVKSTEDFIERAATGSSMGSGTYLVRCGTGAATPSAQWLRAELVRYRQQQPGGKY